MRICIIGKYPPIQGGVSKTNYWIARSLARRGHEVHVVTNADEVEDAFRISLTQEDEPWYQPRFDHGSVRVWNTECFGRRYHHIPQSNPFVTKIASLATEVVESSSSDVILSHYLEPYAVSAYLVSSWSGIPFIVRHAGSDVGRLMKIDNLRRCYTEILRKANLVATRERQANFFLSLGVKPNRLYPDPGFILPQDHFNPQVEPLDLNGFLHKIALSPSDFVQSTIKWHTNPIDVSLPSIGVYGKIGETKGTFDLIKSLSKLKRKGLRFNFIAIAHGIPESEMRFRNAIIEANLEHETRILPFIPHWRIPSFLRSLSVVCVLEREFQVKLHISTLPLEILSCGTCLIVSSEIACKLSFSERLIHGINALIVRNPRNHSELETVLQQVIEDQELSHRIGNQGALLMKHMQDHEACVNRHEHMLNQVLSNVPHAHYLFLLGNSYKGEQRYQGMPWRYFPLTLKILGLHIETVIERFKLIPESQRIENCYQEAMEFCEAVTSVFEQERTLPDYLADIMLWELYRVPKDSEDLVQIAEDMLFRSKQIDGKEVFTDDFTAIPIRLENVSMRGFSYDMEMIARQIEEHGSPQSTIEKNAAFFYLFKYLPERPQVPVLRVDPEVFLLLELCDGCRTVRGIASILVDSDIVEEPLPLKEVEILCARRLAHLFSEGLIRFEKNKRNCVSNLGRDE